MGTRSRSRSQVVPSGTFGYGKDGRYKNESRGSIRGSSAPVAVTESFMRHHSPDMAAGGANGYFGMGMAAPYCQEIKTENQKDVKSRKGVDPPDADISRSRNNRNSNRPSIRASRSGLEPLAENSYEDTPSKSADTPERNTTSTTQRRQTLPDIIPQKNGRLSKDCHSQQKYTNYDLDSIGYLQYHKQEPKQGAHPSKKVQNYHSGHKLENDSRPKHGMQQKKKEEVPKSTSKLEVAKDHDVSELTFRGLDPPERYPGCKPTKHHVSGPQDPPAREGRVGRSSHKRLDPQNKYVVDRREGGVKPSNRSSVPREHQGAVANPNKAIQRVSGQKQSTNRSVTPRENQVASRPSKERSTRRATSGRTLGSSSRSRPPRKIQTAAVTHVGEVKSTKKKKPETTAIKSILKKKEAPPPIAFFGGGQLTTSSDSSSSSGITIYESSRTDSKSSHFSSKASSYNNLTISCCEEDDDTISIDMRSIKSSGSVKSALRRGKFAAAANNFSSTDDEVSVLSSTSRSTFTEDEDESIKFDRTRSHFLRTADLGLTEHTIFAQQFLDNPDATPEPHYHHPTPHPPPGVQFNIDENWICVDDGNGDHSPIAPQAVDAMVAMGYRAASDPRMWTPTSKTRKYMTDKRLTFGDTPIPGPRFEGEGSPSDTDCLLWCGKFSHRYHGSDIPVIRSQGFVNKSAEELVDLLMDSTRVGEYNKTSVGRSDEVVLSYGDDIDCPFSGQKKKKLTGVVIQGAEIVDGCAAFTDDEHSRNDRTSSTSSFRQHKASKFVGVTKLVRSTNKVPLIRKALEFTTLLHCRELLEEQGGNGYIIVGRSITPADDTEKGKGVIRSEVLLNVIIIRRLHHSHKGHARTVPVNSSGRTASKKDMRNRCLLITMNHVKSPLIPKIMAKRVGKSAAANLLLDIRAA